MLGGKLWGSWIHRQGNQLPSGSFSPENSQTQSGIEKEHKQNGLLEAYRSGMKLGVLGLAGLLLLTGCANTPSLADQIKLLEYEKCISAEESFFLALAQNRTREEFQKLAEEIKEEDPLVSSFIERCAKYRP